VALGIRARKANSTFFVLRYSHARVVLRLFATQHTYAPRHTQWPVPSPCTSFWAAGCYEDSRCLSQPYAPWQLCRPTRTPLLAPTSPRGPAAFQGAEPPEFLGRFVLLRHAATLSRAVRPHKGSPNPQQVNFRALPLKKLSGKSELAPNRGFKSHQVETNEPKRGHLLPPGRTVGPPLGHFPDSFPRRFVNKLDSEPCSTLINFVINVC
jgi:hypothetical protein